MPRILLVDDDNGVCALLEDVLINAGYEVDTAPTASGGCALVEQRRYDLVIADGKLPDGTGMDVADRATIRRIKSLIITGYAFSLPGDQYKVLQKPFTPIELIEAVNTAMAEEIQDQNGPEASGKLLLRKAPDR